MNIREFLEEAGLNITRAYGDEIVAYCPWHDDSTASLCINPKSGWHCFAGCGKGRHIKSLLDKIQPNLYQVFVDKFPEVYTRRSSSMDPQEEDITPLFEVDRLPLALNHEYLIQRGITDNTVNSFNLKYHEHFNSIVIPIYQHNELLGTVQRKITGNPKYVNSRGMDRDEILFPLDKVQPQDGKVILVEGLFDAIKAHQEGMVQTLSTFGGFVSPQQVQMLGSLASTIIICPDKDRSGIKMADRTTKMLRQMGLRIEYTFAPGSAKDFGDTKDFTVLEYHSYWKLKALKRNLNFIMERSNA